MQSQKGAVINFFSSFSQSLYKFTFFYLFMPRYHENHQKLATVLRHGCSTVLNTFHWHNRVPEPIFKSLVYFQKRAHFSKKSQKYKGIFPYLCRDPNTRLNIRWRLWKITWPFSLSFLKEIKIPFPFPTLFFQNKTFKTLLIVADTTDIYM